MPQNTAQARALRREVVNRPATAVQASANSNCCSATDSSSHWMVVNAPGMMTCRVGVVNSSYAKKPPEGGFRAGA